MRLILIRHGETESNVNRQLDTAHPGAPLNENGLAQAEALVEAIAHEEIHALYASTLTRAQQTATPLARARELEVIVVDGIQEIAAGVEEMNTDWSVYVGMLNSWAPHNLDAGLEGGETAREFLTRFENAVAAMEQAGDEVVALVSHGAALRVWARPHTKSRKKLLPVPTAARSCGPMRPAKCMSVSAMSGSAMPPMIEGNDRRSRYFRVTGSPMAVTCIEVPCAKVEECEGEIVRLSNSSNFLLFHSRALAI